MGDTDDLLDPDAVRATYLVAGTVSDVLLGVSARHLRGLVVALLASEQIEWRSASPVARLRPGTDLLARLPDVAALGADTRGIRARRVG